MSRRPLLGERVQFTATMSRNVVAEAGGHGQRWIAFSHAPMHGTYAGHRVIRDTLVRTGAEWGEYVVVRSHRVALIVTHANYEQRRVPYHAISLEQQ